MKSIKNSSQEQYHKITQFFLLNYHKFRRNLTRRNKFRNKIKNLLNKNGVEIFDEHDFKTSILFYREIFKSNITYIGATYVENFAKIKEKLRDNKFKELFELDGKCMNAIYFEDNRKAFSCLIFAPNVKIISLNQEVQHLAVDIKISTEIREVATQFNLKKLENLNFGSLMAIGNAYDKLILKTFKLPLHELIYIKYKNMQNEFVKCYLNYKNDITPKEMDHIEHFSRIYYWNIRIMADRFNEDLGKEISIHDVATNLAQFPLMLSVLNEDQLMGLKINKIICSDLMSKIADGFLNWFYSKEQIPHKPIEVINLDLIKQIKDAQETDVIIANDILEHLPENLVLPIVMGLWTKTQKLLFVHVPFEEIPTEAFGHITSFNAEKLRKIALELNNGTLLSDDYFEGECSLTDKGYLIMCKN
jgi:hypothetical protein